GGALDWAAGHTPDIGNGQDLSNLLGKIIRINPVPQGNKPYQIPANNPFVRTPNARPEIYSYGLRNPFRMQFSNFESEASLLIAGDVGQNSFEEIDVIESGKNYGWRYKEGFINTPR